MNGRLEIRLDEEIARYFLDGEPVEPGTLLEMMTLFGWRKGVFHPGAPPALRDGNGEMIPIENNDILRRA